MITSEQIQDVLEDLVKIQAKWKSLKLQAETWQQESAHSIRAYLYAGKESLVFMRDYTQSMEQQSPSEGA